MKQNTRILTFSVFLSRLFRHLIFHLCTLILLLVRYGNVGESRRFLSSGGERRLGEEVRGSLRNLFRRYETQFDLYIIPVPYYHQIDTICLKSTFHQRSGLCSMEIYQVRDEKSI